MMCLGSSTWPKSIVQFDLIPISCAISAVLSHSSPEHLPRTIVSLISLLNISAPPPGRASNPAAFNLESTSFTEFLVNFPYHFFIIIKSQFWMEPADYVKLCGLHIVYCYSCSC